MRHPLNALVGSGIFPDTGCRTPCFRCLLAFRFIHTADLHLDSPLRALALRSPDLARELGVATRAALTRIIDLCIAEDVHFLLIAGDLWDGRHSSTKTPRFLKQELLRLQAAGIRCFVIRGNHDALAKQVGELALPDNVTLFGSRATSEVLDIDGHGVVIHGLSFRDAHAPESLLARFPPASPDAFNIGLMHTSLNGTAGHDVYAPCSAADLHAHGFHYWALGHIHRRSEHHGRATIVMPGIPQGRDMGEWGNTSVTLCRVADDNTLTLEQHCVAAVRFERWNVDCAGVADWTDLLALIARNLPQGNMAEAQCVLRLTLRGATPLAWRIARDLDRLTEETHALAAAVDGLWIDKIELDLDQADNVPAANLPSDLVRLMLEELPDDPGLQGELAAFAEALTGFLPPDLRDFLGEDDVSKEAIRRDLLQEGSARLLARLTPDAAS